VNQARWHLFQPPGPVKQPVLINWYFMAMRQVDFGASVSDEICQLTMLVVCVMKKFLPSGEDLGFSQQAYN
jgi:hypothetical protein